MQLSSRRRKFRFVDVDLMTFISVVDVQQLILISAYQSLQPFCRPLAGEEHAFTAEYSRSCSKILGKEIQNVAKSLLQPNKIFGGHMARKDFSTEPFDIAQECQIATGFRNGRFSRLVVRMHFC